MVFRAGTLFVVATPIGNLEDITARALRVLREVSLIAAEDTRRTARLLTRYAIQTPMTSLHEHNEEKKTPQLVERLRAGSDIAIVSDAGTPTISDPGERLIRAAIDCEVRVEAIPGPTAAVAALAVSGLPSGTYTFLGFPPTRSKARAEWFKRLTIVGGTVVFYEAPHRVRATLQQIQDIVGDCRVSIARELTKVHEELVRGPISAVLAELSQPKGEFTIVLEIGHKPDNTVCRVVDDPELLREFGEITEQQGLKRRQAIGSLARKYSRSVNDVYESLERAKKLGR
jgi:16S rRNA (cytidine1402-2'-O)-methyltransferase